MANDIALATGTEVSEISHVLLSFVLDNCMTSGFDREEITIAVMGLLKELQPKTVLEGMLASHMVISSINAMRMMKKAMPNDQGQPCSTTMNLGIKLQRLFLEQIEALQKLRGERSHQKMTVEHVHVHQGGQAVIGQVKTNTDGERR